LFRQCSKDWAHALLRRCRPAVAAAVAACAFGQHLTCSPAKLSANCRVPSGSGVLSAGGWSSQQRERQLFCCRVLLGRRDFSERPSRHAGVWTNDLSRVEQVTRVEYRFQLAENRVETAILPGYPGGAGQAGPVLRANRAA